MAVRVGVGLGRFPFESIRALRRWLDSCEESAIDSIWQSDQLNASDLSPEPLSLLAMIAGATRRLKIGTNAVVLGFRDPVTFARQCATIDFVSDGRLLPVVGVGRSRMPAWRATGRSPDERGAKANEALEIITRLWAEERVTFKGEHFAVEEASVTPRPVQQPLPLWIGGSSQAAVRRTVRFGGGWLGGLQTVDEAIDTVARIRAESAASVRPIPDDHYGATLIYRIESRPTADADLGPRADGPVGKQISRVATIGDAPSLVEQLRRYARGGISKFVAVPAARGEADYCEQIRLLAAEVIPEAMAISTSSQGTWP